MTIHVPSLAFAPPRKYIPLPPYHGDWDNAYASPYQDVSQRSMQSHAAALSACYGHRFTFVRFVMFCSEL